MKIDYNCHHCDIKQRYIKFYMRIYFPLNDYQTQRSRFTELDNCPISKSRPKALHFYELQYHQVTHKHTDTCVCVCVCVCERERERERDRERDRESVCVYLRHSFETSSHTRPVKHSEVSLHVPCTSFSMIKVKKPKNKRVTS